MTTSNLADELRAHPFLEGLADASVAALSSCARPASFAAGSYILREGGRADTLYLLTSGRAVLEVFVPGRGTTQVETLSGGDILGLHWVFPPKRWVLDARAAEPVTALALDATCLQARLDADPALGYAFSQRLLRHVYMRLERARLQRLDVYKGAAS